MSPASFPFPTHANLLYSVSVLALPLIQPTTCIWTRFAVPLHPAINAAAGISSHKTVYGNWHLRDICMAVWEVIDFEMRNWTAEFWTFVQHYLNLLMYPNH